MLHIAVIRGGPGNTFKSSLAVGGDMLESLGSDSSKHIAHDLFIDSNGIWHRRGIPQHPLDALRGIDVAVLALHGPYAESGDVQKHLERHAVPFTGTRNLASARARNKADAKAHLSALKDLNSQYKIPPSLLVANSPEVHFANTAREVFQRFGPPYVVKPVHGGNSHSIEIAETVFALPAAIERVMGETGDDVLIEQYVLGRHVSSYVVEGFRNQDTYVLPTVETNLLKGNRGITREQKRDEYAHTDVLQHVSLEVKKQLEDAAREIHEKLDLSHYSKIDFILAPHGAYFLEANTHPDLGANSALPKPLDYVGSTLKELYHHLTHIARQ